ncbi:type II toxin-antitoxin system VapC family toxin [archaeon]|nr:type II toxin-antitoxin system VapC family toxin [archaeon]
MNANFGYRGRPLRFVDANVFIYFLADDPLYGKPAAAIMQRIEAGEPVAVSTLVLAQVCAYLQRRAPQYIPLFLASLRLPNVIHVSTTYSDFLTALDLLEQLHLSHQLWDDAVLVAQMQRLHIREIYSNDRDFDHFPQVKRLFA